MNNEAIGNEGIGAECGVCMAVLSPREPVLYTHTIERDGFKVRFDALMADDDDVDPDGNLEPEQLGEIMLKMDNFDLHHFQARVTASKCGIDLADTYLGQCLYTKFEDFHGDENGYYDDMCNDVIGVATGVIAQLADGVVPTFKTTRKKAF